MGKVTAGLGRVYRSGRSSKAQCVCACARVRADSLNVLSTLYFGHAKCVIQL